MIVSAYLPSGSPLNGLSGYRPCCSRFLRRPSIAPASPMSRRSNHSWLTKLLLTRIVCEGSHAIRQGLCGFAHDRVGRDRGRLYGMTRFCNPCLCLWRIVICLRTIDWNLVYPDRQTREAHVASSKSMFLGLGLVAGIGIGAVASSFAFSPWQDSPLMRGQGDNWNTGNELGTLSSNDGIYVDVKDFKITRGAAKGDPAAQIAKLGAREASDG